ncbi:PREDICTED: uncharacterized protein LOC18599617 isoform X2 [Theobroma cacao]|uniref:Uncharacterized protein LOC18599617 isoform X2 n=1 Tax=Theobroma cacao TaxID=3641 RepID=A0AB32WCJ6_THECC|nr:PREDICTED: uncharacterized protein LOC18599617 isoform X2 [Theobroma cacao]
MEIVATCSSSFATEVAKVVPIKRHVSYILDRQKNLEDFKKKAKQLEDERESVKHAVEAAERNGEKIELGVRKWLISVDQKIKEYDEKVRALEDKAKERCFNALCPNVKFYYRLGKKAQEHAKVVAELLEQGRFDRISYRPAPEGIGTMSNNYYEAFQSRGSILEGIMENLRDPILKMIGVYGMPGVGKTMLVKEVARTVREEYLFDEVVMATITHNPNITNIQGEIADMLGLRFDEESESGRAMRLRQRLRSDKKVLVILDDIWAKLDLDAIGISLEDDKNIAPDENEGSIMQNIAPDENQGSIMQNINGSSLEKVSTVKSKILLTSRNLDVLCRMDAEKKFECRILSREEAMTLFVRIVGDVVHNPSYKPIANQVVEKCAGLPVAVSTIANTLKGMNLDIWENALRQLKRSNATNIEGMEEGVYSIIELSYERLKEEAQSLFRLCALYRQGSDIPIRNYLLRHHLGLDLLEGVRTLEEARKSVSDLVHKLKSSSLLLSGCNDEFVKMHDIVRDVSISIASQENQMFVIEEGIRMKDLLKKGKLNNCTALSLPYGDIHQELPKVLECPKLKLFLLTEDDDRQSEVPDTFFEKMNDLQVLQLNGMRFPSLPSSFLSLTNLQTLCLDFCALSDIALIANLKKLDILSLCSSKIKQLPNEIAQLTQLRLLDLSNCFKLEVIPANILSSLTCLEELHMGNSFNRWDVEGNASLVELKNLDRLTTLDVHIRDAQSLPKDLFSETKLERYKIFVGEALWDWFDKHKYSRTLKLMPNTRINWDRGIRMLLTRTEDLYVNEVQGVKSSLHELGETGFPHLKNVHVENNSEIQYIINSIRGISCEAFPLLESLFLHNLSNLKNISHAQIYVECFRSLKIIKVINCDSLKNLFSFSLAEKLFQLQEIEVTDCKNIVDIIGADRERDNEATDQIELRELRSITLQCLPQLINFRFQEKKHSTTSSIASPLFTGKMAFPLLENLKVSSINIERIWPYQLPRVSYSMQNLTSLIIEGCDNLRDVLSYSMAESLQQLKSFEVIDCRCIQQIVAMEEIKEGGNRATVSFPRLISLKLKDLHKLIGFCHENYFLEFPSLKILEIKRCLELKGFINVCIGSTTEVLFNEQVAFPNLERMTISHLRNVKRLWYNQLHTNSFCKMKELKAEYCDELLNIFPSFVLGIFHKLETLRVTDCGSLEEVFELQAQGLEIKDTCVVAFHLKELMLFRLPKLKHVWNKDPQGNISFQTLRVVNVRKCWSLKSLFPFSIAKGLPQLESLLVQQCGVEEIVSKNEGLEQEIRFEFNQLSFLKLWKLTNLKCFYPGMHTIVWPVLKNLKTHGCEEIKIFGQLEAHIQKSLFVIEKIIPQLEEVSFSSDDIAMICDGQFASHFFCHIKLLQITCYLDESAVFPFFFLQRFYNLEMLQVFGCNFKELSPYERNVGKDKEVRMLSKLRKLKLDSLQKIIHVWKRDSPLGHMCASLETLEVWKCDSLINLGVSSASFDNLISLDVWKCKGIVELITSSEAQSLVRLVTMRIRECEMMKEVVGREEDESTYEIIFRELKHVELHCLPSLRSFCSGNSSFKFPSLEQVIVSQCPRLKSFCLGALSTPKLQRVQLESTDYKGRWAGDLGATVKQLHQEKVGYQCLKHLKLSEFPELVDIWNGNPQEILDLKNLEFLEFCNSDNLGCIFNLSMALSLVRLQQLEIKKCNKMEAVIKEDGSVLDQKTRTDKIIIFPCLKSIFIEHCPDLTSFCWGSPILMECPSLKIIEVAHCPNMTTFVSIFPRDEEKNARIGDGTDRKEDDLEILPAFFCDKVVFPNLEKMTISHLRNVKRLWFNQFHADSFCKMKELKVEYCDELLNIFPSFVLGVFQRLEMLRVTDCGSLEEVFELGAQGLEIKDTCVLALQLKELYLYRLPKLKRVWNKEPQGDISFQTLHVVKVRECWSLKSLFPFSIAKGLPQLERLLVQQCAVEEIVSKNEGLEQEIRLEFNQLSFLKLWKLTNLKCFYPGMHTIVWPVLKNLKTHGCEEVKIFGQLESHIEQSLFVIEKIIPQLEEVSFSSDDIAMICDGQFASHFFCHIKLLQITCYLDESAVLPVFFLQRFYNLEMLQVFGCNFKELSPYQGNFSEDKEVRMLSKLRKLKLDSLQKITHLWKRDSPLGHMCASLETLEVWRCDSLINLGVSSASFDNLISLDVWKCKRIVELITFSEAQSLVHLVTMRIRECEMMKEVVESERDDESTYEIIFRELKHVELHCLPSLGSFCSGNSSFKFPSLEQVIVSQCPRLKSFCLGALSTPKLQRVQLESTDYKGRWAGDLGATVEHLHQEKVGYQCLKHLKLSEFPELVDIWNRNPQEILDLKNLEFLEFCNSDNLGCIFNLSMALSLVRLRQLEIKKCNKMEAVIKEDGSVLDQEARKDKIVIFPCLKSIFIVCCPDLTSFYLGNPTLMECPSLKKIEIAHCPNLTTCGSIFPRDEEKNARIGDGIERNEDDLEILPAFFCDKIMFPKLEKLKLSSISIERIWHYQIAGGSNSMQNLTSLIIEGCDNLKHILLYSMAECLQQLQIFEVIDCRCIQEIVAREEIKEDGERATISFPLLTSLKLKGLPKLIGFCHENYFLEFPSLKILEIEHCLEIKGFINKSMSKDMTIGSTTEALFNEQVAFPNLERVTISHLRNVKRLWYNQLHADSFCKMKELKAEYCDELLNIFPSFVLGVFYKLEILRVTDCGSLEEVYELQAQGLEIKDTCVVAFQLKEMRLFRLPKLKHVWNKHPQGNISFQTLRIVDVWECWSLKSLFPFSIAKGLPQLERLIVQECGVEEIVSKNEGLEQEIRFEFNHLSFIKLWILRSLKCFYPGKHTAMWPVLKKLRIHRCGKIKILGQLESLIQQPLMEKVIPQLEEALISSDEIAKICDGHYSEKLFCHLKVLWVTYYLNESVVSSFSFLQRFNNLEALYVLHANFKELSLYEGNFGEEKEVWMLPKIKRLHLEYLCKVTHLWKQESLLGHICASLETLEVWNCDSLINLGSSSASFENLTTLDVWKCKGIIELITSSKAQSLVLLVQMRIRECEMMKEVVASEGDDEATYEIIFRELKRLELHCLASLRSFCSGNYTLKFPSLEQVIVSQCPRLNSFCHGALSTPKLQRVQLEPTHYKGRWIGDLNATVEQLYEEKVGYRSLKHLKLSEFDELVDIWNRNPQEVLDFKRLEFLEFCNSDNLGCIFNLSMAFSLVRLQQLQIKTCNKMEAVIKEEGFLLNLEARTDKIVIFPHLKSIFIECCPDLKCFYLRSSTLMECPSLEKIEVAHCPNMTTFVSTFRRDEEKKPIIGDGIERNEDDLHILTAFFSDKVAFPNLEKVTISHLRKVKRLWFNQLHADSFCKMKELKVEFCDELLNIFPSFVLGVLHKLEILRVTDCGSLEEVFQHQAQGLEIKDTCVVAFQLKELILFRLPKLKHVWNKDPQGNISFQTLRKVKVRECWSLKSLFPFSIAKGLPQLESLLVEESGVEEIVSKNEGLEQEIWFEFNQLSFLKLWQLTNLKCFYPGMHTTVWPVLKKLWTYCCGKIKIFGQLESHIQQPLFLIEKVIPQLDEVSFRSDDIAMICDGQFPSDFFCHMKLLQITCYLDESAVFPFFFLQRFYNLEVLGVIGCNFKELSPYEGNFSEDKEVRMLSKLRKLKLDSLQKIIHLWKQESPLGHMCASLETLEVWRCDSLINLGASSAPFDNLISLDVWKCRGIVELITSSKVQSLVRLVTMKIRECEMMKEVVASDEDDESTYEIIFRELKHVELHGLPSLRSFCSGNYSFNFPSLEQVIVSECPSLKSFCRGALSTPKLERVQPKRTDCKGRWAGDLDATIEQLYMEQNVQISEEKTEGTI